jgi:hypothetical protein
VIDLRHNSLFFSSRKSPRLTMTQPRLCFPEDNPGRLRAGRFTLFSFQANQDDDEGFCRLILFFACFAQPKG